MEFLEAWDARYAHAPDQVIEAPDRSTLYRWMQGAWPNSAKQLVRLSSLLDIDPICLLDISEHNAAETMAMLYQSYQNKRWAPQALSVLSDFVGHKDEWPPHKLSTKYYGRDWRICDIEHDLTCGINFYAVVEIASTPADDEDHPQVFHFAYRHATLFGKQWVQYGYVARYGEDCQLVSINGHVSSCTFSTLEAPTHIETWFGPSPTIIRIASLHEFTAKIVANPTAIDVCLRFPV